MPDRSLSSDPEVKILLVEDDEIDVELLRRSFRKHGLTNEVIVAEDGPEALAYLRSCPLHPAGVVSVLVLLDLKLPTMTGLDFLKAVREDEVLKRNVVFVLTTSEREEDQKSAYDQNVAGYLVKGKLGKDSEVLCQLLKSYCEANRFP